MIKNFKENELNLFFMKDTRRANPLLCALEYLTFYLSAKRKRMVYTFLKGLINFPD